VSQLSGTATESAATQALAQARAAAQAASSRESERILAGIGLVVLAVACFATLDTATKISTQK